jgi:hypothetical protein
MKKLRATKGTYYFVPEHYVNTKKVTVIMRALSHSELLSLENLLDENRDRELNVRAAETAIIKIEAFDGSSIPFEDLPYDVIVEVAEKVLELSHITIEEYERLNTSIEIHFDRTYQTDTWKCSVCRKKRLDRVRNCGFRGEKDKDPSFVTYVNNHPYSYCPIYDVDKEILADAVECYNAYDAGFLPDSGGFYDQTRFFVHASQMIFSKLKEEERKELEKLKNKSK